MKNDNQNEMMVDQFYDLITDAEQRVKHAAHFVLNQDQTKLWEWQLAGTYIIANSCSTVAMTCDGLRLARFTAPPGLAFGGRFFIYVDCLPDPHGHKCPCYITAPHKWGFYIHRLWVFSPIYGALLLDG